MSLTPEEKDELTATARLATLMNEGVASRFWQEIAEYIDRRRAAIKNEAFTGDPEELAAHQARENELAQLLEFIAVADKKGVDAARELEIKKAV